MTALIGVITSGTGARGTVFLLSDTLLATAAHCVVKPPPDTAPEGDLLVAFPGAPTFSVRPVPEGWRPGGADVALLRPVTEMPEVLRAQAASHPLEIRDPRSDDDLAVAPWNLKLDREHDFDITTVGRGIPGSDGAILMKVSDGDRDVKDGFSGAPVLALKDGTVTAIVGLLRGRLEEGESEAEVIPGSVLQAALRAVGEAPPDAKAPAPPSSITREASIDLADRMPVSGYVDVSRQILPNEEGHMARVLLCFAGRFHLTRSNGTIVFAVRQADLEIRHSDLDLNPALRGSRAAPGASPVTVSRTGGGRDVTNLTIQAIQTGDEPAFLKGDVLGDQDDSAADLGRVRNRGDKPMRLEADVQLTFQTASILDEAGEPISDLKRKNAIAKVIDRLAEIYGIDDDGERRGVPLEGYREPEAEDE